jgi:hypothetical protein
MNVNSDADSEGRTFPQQTLYVGFNCECSVECDRLYVNLRSRTLQTLRHGDVELDANQMAALEHPNGRMVLRGTRTSTRLRADDAGQPIVVFQLEHSIGEECVDVPEYVERREDGVELVSRASWARRGTNEIICEFAECEIRRPGLRPIIVRRTPGRRRDDPKA